MLKMATMSIGKKESFNFYKYICQKIGTEEAVRFRRLAFTVRDIGQRGTIIISGSKGEGLNLNGSDLDVMIIDTTFKVYRSKTDVPSQCFPSPLIMNTEETHPCFTQLWMLNKNQTTIPNVLYTNHQGNMLSSELFKMCCKNHAAVNIFKLFSGIIHGPCISDKDETFDLVWCLKCDNWIFQATSWVSRTRTTWPSPGIISKIVSCGVLFVPIGCKGSINEHLEWRISFSVAETFLIFSFSHPQLLCYALLKILLKEIIETHADLKGLLCSYFLKTLMFWISEETETYVWRPDNIIPCFMACLQRLMYCVRYSILSHYFIPENNLFLRFDTDNNEQLTTILTDLYGHGITCFTSSATLRDYQSQFRKMTNSLLSGNNIFAQQIMPTFLTFCHSSQVNLAKVLYEFLHHSRTGLSRSLFALQFSMEFSRATKATQYPNILGNENNYVRYKHDLSHLAIGLHFDAVSGLLMLASFFYVHKNYLASLTIIKYILLKYTDEKIYLGSAEYERPFNHFQNIVLNLMKNEKLYTIIKSLTIASLLFKMESSIIPQELLLDVKRTHNSFHPLPFAHFLNFLCSYHLNDISSCRQSLQRLGCDQWRGPNYLTKLLYPEDVNTIILYGIALQLMRETCLAKFAYQAADLIDIQKMTSAGSRLHSLI
ncbi:uncharacterized protein LOC134692590 [Mytilus trossulus]|uniref:uncharacterized protein LOC134692590 n=1 Tax=Mytilus trossulus TaxID=6551 RepID=UPI003004C174